MNTKTRSYGKTSRFAPHLHLLHELWDTYKTPQGGLSLKRAFTDRPDAQELLHIETKGDRLSLQSYVARRIATGKWVNQPADEDRVMQAPAPAVRRKYTRHNNTNGQNGQPTLTLAAVHYCPGCGLNLLDIARALTVAQSL